MLILRFSFHRIGVIILLLNYVCGFTKHAVKLIDITEKEEDSKKVQCELFRDL